MRSGTPRDPRPAPRFMDTRPKPAAHSLESEPCDDCHRNTGGYSRRANDRAQPGTTAPIQLLSSRKAQARHLERFPNGKSNTGSCAGRRHHCDSRQAPKLRSGPRPRTAQKVLCTTPSVPFWPPFLDSRLRVPWTRRPSLFGKPANTRVQPGHPGLVGLLRDAPGPTLRT
jgi:hypothetical protein